MLPKIEPETSSEWFLVAGGGTFVLRITATLRIGEDEVGDLALNPPPEQELVEFAQSGDRLVCRSLRDNLRLALHGRKDEYLFVNPGRAMKLRLPNTTISITRDYISGGRDPVYDDVEVVSHLDGAGATPVVLPVEHRTAQTSAAPLVEELPVTGEFTLDNIPVLLTPVDPLPAARVADRPADDIPEDASAPIVVTEPGQHKFVIVGPDADDASYAEYRAGALAETRVESLAQISARTQPPQAPEHAAPAYGAARVRHTPAARRITQRQESGYAFPLRRPGCITGKHAQIRTATPRTEPDIAERATASSASRALGLLLLGAMIFLVPSGDTGRTPGAYDARVAAETVVDGQPTQPSDSQDPWLTEPAATGPATEAAAGVADGETLAMLPNADREIASVDSDLFESVVALIESIEQPDTATLDFARHAAEIILQADPNHLGARHLLESLRQREAHRVAIAADTGASGQAPVTADVGAPPSAFLDGRIAEAEEMLREGAIIEPTGHNAVKLLEEVLESDPGNPAALALIRQCADELVAQAKLAHVSGEAYSARNLLEEVLAFQPSHPEAQALWQQVTTVD